MLVTRRMHLDLELLKWIVLMAFALALAWGFAIQTAGGDELKRFGEPFPELIPMPNVADALAPKETIAPFFPEIGPRVTAVDPEMGAMLWGVLREHRLGNREAVAEQWRKAMLPADAEVWRQVALGVNALQGGDLEGAAVRLDAARVFAPQNPVVAYYWGILRLEQAAQAGQGEMLPAQLIALVAYPPRMVPAERSMFQLAAMMEFKDVIAWKDEINLADPLAAQAGSEGPTIGDYLTVLGAVDYVGRAHHMLGQLYLDRGMLIDAEEHFDAAIRTGVQVPYGYRELGEAFGEADQHGAAARVYFKALGQHADGLVRPGRKVIQHLEQLLRW